MSKKLYITKHNSKTKIDYRKLRSLLIKISFLIVLFVFLALVYGAGTAKNVPMKKIEKAMSSSKYTKGMETQTPRELARYMKLSSSDFDGFYYARATDNLAVDEVLVVKAKSRDQLNQLKDAVETRVNQQTKNYQGYAPKQVAKLKNHKVLTKGKYLFYCVADKPDKISEVLTDVI